VVKLTLWRQCSETWLTWETCPLSILLWVWL